MTSINSSLGCSEIAKDCLASVAKQLLGWDTMYNDNVDQTAIVQAISAHIPITTETYSLAITIVASDNDAEKLVREMLMYEEDEELPSDTNFADSVGEFCNLVAGEIKKRLHSQGHAVKISVPCIEQGIFESTTCKYAEPKSWQFELGPIHGHLKLEQTNITGDN